MNYILHVICDVKRHKAYTKAEEMGMGMGRESRKKKMVTEDR